MIVDLAKLDIQLARNLATMHDLTAVISHDSVYKIRQGKSVHPKVTGKVAEYLHCDVTDILA